MSIPYCFTLRRGAPGPVTLAADLLVSLLSPDPLLCTTTTSAVAWLMWELDCSPSEAIRHLRAALADPRGLLRCEWFVGTLYVVRNR